MAKHSVISFNKKLNKLFYQRTLWLRKAIDKGNVGRPPIFNRKKISKNINELQNIASECVTHTFAKNEFEKTIDKKKQWRVNKRKGWGWKAKRENFSKWFEANIDFPNCIYIFWSNSKCVYVGRTVRGKGRPQNHFNKNWFYKISRVDIYSTSKASEVPKLECLAIHRFRPKENGMKASIPKWAKKCPVCNLRKQIKSELSKIFRIKK